jgi:hypothetical protein
LLGGLGLWNGKYYDYQTESEGLFAGEDKDQGAKEGEEKD